MKRTHLFVITLLLLVAAQANAQVVQLTVSDSSKMVIAGTSSLHDWTSDVTEIAGSVSLSDKVYKKGFKSGDKVDAVTLEIPVLSIKSPRGATMEQKIYNALQSEAHPYITFTLTDNRVTSAEKNSFTLQANGQLEIAGKSRDISLTVSGRKLPDESLSFDGAYKLNMKDYEVEPPTAMFGQIVTGEEVEISFTLIATK